MKILAATTDQRFAAWGTYHYTGADAVTWYGFAKAIFTEAARFGLTAPRLQPAIAAPIAKSSLPMTKAHF